MRKLHVIPIVHSRQDLGSLDGPIQEFKDKRLPDAAVRLSQNAVENFWQELRLGIQSWQLDFRRVLVFQDALPHTGNPDRIIEHKIVRDLSAKGSPNHQLLEWLLGQGAMLVGTESTELLLKELEEVRKSIANGFQGFDTRNTEPYHSSLLAQRDRFIADRISNMLQDNLEGILFIGMLHRVEDFLDESILVDHPFGRPSAVCESNDSTSL